MTAILADRDFLGLGSHFVAVGFEKLIDQFRHGQEKPEQRFDQPADSDPVEQSFFLALEFLLGDHFDIYVF